ncbi:MAG: DoxX family protein [Limisphaerales bacterium]
MNRLQTITCWILQIVAAGILFQTLFFKFTGAAESVEIFSTLGLEPWGRIGSGIAELIACVLLLTPRTVVWGALLSLGVMAGAILAHLTRLGIVVRNDGGVLFALAVTVFVASAVVLVLRRQELRLTGTRGDPEAFGRSRHTPSAGPRRSDQNHAAASGR